MVGTVLYVGDTEKNKNIHPNHIQFTVLGANGGEGRYKKLTSKPTITI